jgi:transcriptional regulator with XRE-family HTH domain
VNSKELKRKRSLEGIPARLLAGRAGVPVSRLSDIERGYVEPSADETRRLEIALSELILARKEVEDVAQRVGWPL